MGLFAKLFGSRQPNPEVEAAIKSGAKIIDVRTASEFAAGHARGANNIPLPEISPEHAKFPRATGAPLVVCCRSGARSAQAAKSLCGLGIACVDAGPWTVVQAAIDAKANTA